MAGALDGAQCLALAAVGGQGAHEHRPPALAIGVRNDETFELGGSGASATGGKQRLGGVVLQGHAQRPEPHTLARRHRHRVTAPARERRRRIAGGREPLDLAHIDVRDQAIGAADSLNGARANQPPQPADRVLQSLLRGERWVLAPDVVDELPGRHRVRCAHGEGGEHRGLSPGNRRAVDLDGTEDANLHNPEIRDCYRVDTAP